MRAAPQKLEDKLEKEWEHEAKDLWTQLGWLAYHTFDSRRSPAGFPDWVLVRERIIYLELKREKKAPTDKQKVWLKRLLAAGAEVYVPQPHHLEQLALILACRGDPWSKAMGPALEAAALMRAELVEIVK